MKNTLTFLMLFLLAGISGIAQVGINADGTAPNNSAMLDIKSSSKGLLPPRMTTTQRNSIVSPAFGLLIYNSDCNDMQYFNGAGWIPMGNTGMLVTPGSISGNVALCANATGITYSIAAVTNASGYHWTVPSGASIAAGQGTTNITVAFGSVGGVICVAAYNDCYRSMMSCLTITLSPSVVVGVSISASANPVCAGTSVIFSSSVSNSGTSPTFQWKVNGSVISGATGTTYSYSPANNDAITCVLTSNVLCASGNPATSNAISMSVNPTVTAGITIAASANPVNAGTSVTFTASPVNGGSNPVYQWKANGNNAGTNLPAYTYTPANLDSITCLLFSNQVCTSGNPSLSNTIVMHINSSLSLTAIVTDYIGCEPGSIDVTPSGGIPPYTYLWSNGATTEDLNNLWSGGDYSITLTDANLSTIVDSWHLTESGELSWTGVMDSTLCDMSCDGSVTTISTSGGTPPYTYFWQGPNGFSATTPDITGLCQGLYHLTVTDSHGCDVRTGRELHSPQTLIISDNILITPATCINMCNGGINISVSGGTPPYSFIWSNGAMTEDISGLCANNYSVTITDSHQCTFNGNWNVGATPPLPVSISISASANPVTSGSTVIFTASPVNGGVSPVYQWKKNGINVGMNSATYSYIPANNDSIKCLLTSGLSCVSGNPATSNLIVLTVLAGGIPCPGTPTVTYGGQVYNTVQIGSQCWLKENLNIGTRIDGALVQTNNGVIEKYCYNDLESNCVIYGGLYQWNEMMTYASTAGVQGICPSGWHIPMKAQWNVISGFLGGDLVSGGKMKTTGTLQAGTGLWYSPNAGATNESGFSAVPAGGHSPDGQFNQIGQYGSWWCSDTSTSDAWNRFVFNDVGYLFTGWGDGSNGFSVRCLKD
ncbi:MAG: hypothetical protein NT004_19750 [Bacteroidetes bacterium]|nr:hypothetical protein [Bacteroidota bacterium]